MRSKMNDENDEHIIVLSSEVPIKLLLLLVLNQLKNIYRSHLENAGQSLNQSGFSFWNEFTCQPIKLRRLTPVSFFSCIAAETEYMQRRKTWGKKINVHLWPSYIFFILWNHLQLEYTCNAARYKMELRAGRVLAGVGTNLKLQRDLLFAAKRVDADVHFGFCRLKWPKFSFLRNVCEFIPC